MAVQCTWKKNISLKLFISNIIRLFSWLLDKNLIQISKKSLERNVARYLYKSPIPITTEEVAYHGKQTILWVSYKSPISGRLFKIHSPQQDSPVSEKTFSLCYLVDQVRVRYFVSSLVHSSIPIKHRYSPVSEIVFILFSWFFQWTKS